jgi:hypothetical protein
MLSTEAVDKSVEENWVNDLRCGFSSTVVNLTIFCPFSEDAQKQWVARALQRSK